MEFCTHEALLPNHFQKDRLRLVNKSSLSKRKKPSKYSSKSQIKSGNINTRSYVNGSLPGVQPAFKLEPNRRAVSESRLNVIDYSQSRFDDLKKCSTSDLRKSTVLIQTWERRSQYDCKKTQALANHCNNSIQPYRTFGTHCNKDNPVAELKKPSNMLDRPLQVVSAMSVSKPELNYVGCNGTTRPQEVNNFKRANSRQSKPRPKSLNVVISDESGNQEPEWISLSRKLCAKFVQSHLEPDVPNSSVVEVEKVSRKSTPKVVAVPKPVEKKVENYQKSCPTPAPTTKITEKPQWIDLSRKLCTKFIEEHIECEPCDVENQRVSPCPGSILEVPKTEVRIIEKLGRRVDVQERKHDEQPEWITLSRKLRAKFIEGHRDDPDTISLDNQLNASDLEEYGSDFKHHRKNQEPSPHQPAYSAFVPVINELYKLGTAENLPKIHKSVLETSENEPKKVPYRFWSDAPHHENGFNNKSDYIPDHHQIPEQVSSRSSNSQGDEDDNDVNYELTFETFETEPPEMECRNSGDDIHQDDNVIIQKFRSQSDEHNVAENENKKSKSLCDLTSMYDCDSLEYCKPLQNGHSEPSDHSMTQHDLYSHKHTNGHELDQEDFSPHTRFKITYPERDKNEFKSRSNGVVHKNTLSTSSITSNASNTSCGIPQQSNCENLIISIPSQSLNSLSENAHHVTSSKRFSDSYHINGSPSKVSTPCVEVMNHSNSINNSPSHVMAKVNTEYGILDSDPVQEEHSRKYDVRKTGGDKHTLIQNDSVSHQPKNARDVDEFGSRDRNFITAIAVEKGHDDEIFLPKSFDDSLKCKIKISHYAENGTQNNDSEMGSSVSKNQASGTFLASSGKQQLNEVIKEKNIYKISGHKENSIPIEAINGNAKLHYWSSDQSNTKPQISFDCAEYENIPRDLIRGSPCSRQSTSYYKDAKASKLKENDRFNEYIPDDNSSYRPVNPPLEFEMFELPSLCSPENQKILLSRSSAVKDMTLYDDEDHTGNKIFNSLQHADVSRAESSDSETPNSTPFDARTLVSPSSYASDSETSSWTLTKNNSYTVNRSPVLETDVSDCSLSVKCDYTPSCSNQSTMESKDSKSLGDDIHISANGHSVKNFKTAENRFSEVFVDCETSKNWKKSHSLDHLEDKGSTAGTSSFYVHLQDKAIRSSEDLPKAKEITDSTDNMPESLRHLFNMPINNPIYTPAAKTSMLLSKTAEPPPCHYYSVASSGSSSVKETKASKKSKKSDRSSSLKIKDIAQGIILTFRKFHSHSKSSHVSPSHYVDVSHLAENKVTSGSNNSQKNMHSSNQNTCVQDIPATYGKVHSNRTFSGGYFGHRSTSESNLYLPTNASKLCTCDNLPPPISHREPDERSKSFNFGKLGDIKCTKQHKKPHEMKEKKTKNHHSGKSRSKKLEPKATSSVSRKVQQMADGTLYLVTTISGDTAVPGVYSDSPDTSSEVSSHGPTKRPGESNC